MLNTDFIERHRDPIGCEAKMTTRKKWTYSSASDIGIIHVPSILKNVSMLI